MANNLKNVHIAAVPQEILETLAKDMPRVIKWDVMISEGTIFVTEDRDDENWLCHTLYFPGDKRVTKRAVNFSPKTVPTFEPKIRTY